MEATIINFRGGKHTQYTNQMIIVPADISKREQAEKLIGKQVTFTTKGKKIIIGKVAAAHGNKGAVRVIFEKGMPGQAISEKVEII